jgi:hypothetical protein
MYPTYRYHPTLAPNGRKFTDQAELDALSDEWVDTPTKFPSADAESPHDDLGTVQPPKKRGWTRTERDA